MINQLVELFKPCCIVMLLSVMLLLSCNRFSSQNGDTFSVITDTLDASRKGSGFINIPIDNNQQLLGVGVVDSLYKFNGVAKMSMYELEYQPALYVISNSELQAIDITKNGPSLGVFKFEDSLAAAVTVEDYQVRLIFDPYRTTKSSSCVQVSSKGIELQVIDSIGGEISLKLTTDGTVVLLGLPSASATETQEKLVPGQLYIGDDSTIRIKQ